MIYTKEGNSKNIRLIADERMELRTVKSLRCELEGCIKRGYEDITIDFRNVKMIDCSAIGVIIAFHKKLKRLNGSIHLENVRSAHVQNLFNALRLSSILNIK
ncbi:STAS domain-containing protein [Desulfuribacillus alkaliarsenatis]|uniref:STAS domain-containing protein n=1 Tax=Desulfuribacillus alkaliarsenatis TaxID=766136 RepID=A0A1E5FZ83_9FIRM|nr:STAS domain-containing protein [Desulfuribacillus alkaliarsenatis]OEF95885.1 hypothetical protein BHF68_10860 [Desulfuribacillus alkaliarsenatis]